MVDINNREILIDDNIIARRSSSDRFEKGIVVGFTPKMIKIESEDEFSDAILKRNVNYVAVVTDFPKETIDFMLKSFNNLV